MKTRILKDEVELVMFKERYEQSGYSVSLSYLRQATVRAFFNSQGRMIAGYTVSRQRPLRYEMLIPEQHHAKLPVFASDLSLCELAAMWIYEKPGRFSSQRIYIQSAVDALLSGAQYIIGGSVAAKLYWIQIQLFPQVYYRGETTYFGKPERCWVYGAPRSVLLGKLIATVSREFAGRLLGLPSYRDKARLFAEKETSRIGA